MDKNRQFITALIGICLLAIFFRFWNYSERFGLAYDQAHDVIVAREAIRTGQIPLVGPFSSAGPFQTAGTWYWIIMFPYLLFPQSVLSPWVFMTVSSVLMVLGLGLLGKSIEGRKFGLLCALLAAVSTAQLAQSVNLTNQTPIAYLSFLVIVCSVWYIRRGTLLAAFFMAFFAAFAASVHLQGVVLFLLCLSAIIVRGGKIARAVLPVITGAILPFIPIVIWDSTRDFVTFRKMVRYYTVDQYAISLDTLGRRWLTYATQFWPAEWSHISGGLRPVGWLIIGLLVIVFLLFLFRRKLKKEWIALGTAFAGMVVIVRYTRVPIFSSFITFSHPFVLLFTAWITYETYRYKKILGMILFAVVFIGSMRASWNEAFGSRINMTAKASMETVRLLDSLYPGKTFSVYDFEFSEARRSVPTVVYLDHMGKISPDGIKIGYLREAHVQMISPVIISTPSGFIADITGSSSARLTELGWERVNPSDIYKNTQDWYVRSQ